jgi:hypothetical protein
MNELKAKLLNIIAELNEAATMAAKTKREQGLAAGLPMLGLSSQLHIEAGKLAKIVREI